MQLTFLLLTCSALSLCVRADLLKNVKFIQEMAKCESPQYVAGDTSVCNEAYNAQTLDQLSGTAKPALNAPIWHTCKGDGTAVNLKDVTPLACMTALGERLVKFAMPGAVVIKAVAPDVMSGGKKVYASFSVSATAVDADGKLIPGAYFPAIDDFCIFHFNDQGQMSGLEDTWDPYMVEKLKKISAAGSSTLMATVVKPSKSVVFGMILMALASFAFGVIAWSKRYSRDRDAHSQYTKFLA